MSGLFITLEGGEGAGKTTQSDALARHLESAGCTAVQVHDPGGTALSDYIRQWVKASKPRMSLEAELLLFTAARAQLVRDVIQPWLEKGAVVISDRYRRLHDGLPGIRQGSASGAGQRSERHRNRRSLAEPDLPAGSAAQGGPTPRTAPGPRSMTNGSTPQDARRNPTSAASKSWGCRSTRRFGTGTTSSPRRSRSAGLVLDAQQPVAALATQIWERVQPLLPGA